MLPSRAIRIIVDTSFLIIFFFLIEMDEHRLKSKFEGDEIVITNSEVESRTFPMARECSIIAGGQKRKTCQKCFA